MSKSLGNSPDPIELMKQYGADGVRVGMLLTLAAGNDLPFRRVSVPTRPQLLQQDLERLPPCQGLGSQ